MKKLTVALIDDSEVDAAATAHALAEPGFEREMF